MNRRLGLTEPSEQLLGAILSRSAQSRSVDQAVNVGETPMHVVVHLLMLRGATMAMVKMGMRPSMVMATTLVVVASVIVRVINRSMLPFDAKFRCCNASSRDALGPDRRRCDREAAQRAADLLQLHAGVDQRTEHHVTGGTGKAIEVQDLHNLSIVPSAESVSRRDEESAPIQPSSSTSGRRG